MIISFAKFLKPFGDRKCTYIVPELIFLALPIPYPSPDSQILVLNPSTKSQSQILVPNLSPKSQY